MAAVSNGGALERLRVWLMRKGERKYFFHFFFQKKLWRTPVNGVNPSAELLQ